MGTHYLNLTGSRKLSVYNPVKKFSFYKIYITPLDSWPPRLHGMTVNTDIATATQWFFFLTSLAIQRWYSLLMWWLAKQSFRHSLEIRKISQQKGVISRFRHLLLLHAWGFWIFPFLFQVLASWSAVGCCPLLVILLKLFWTSRGSKKLGFIRTI